MAVGYCRIHISLQKTERTQQSRDDLFVGMGSAILVALKPLMDCLSAIGASPAFWWLLGGGASYIMGAVFYSLRKPYMHAVFHLFCLGGSIGHIIAIWLIL
ncbi:hemolysin III family protein [Bacteroides fragilis]